MEIASGFGKHLPALGQNRQIRGDGLDIGAIHFAIAGSELRLRGLE